MRSEAESQEVCEIYNLNPAVSAIKSDITPLKKHV